MIFFKGAKALITPILALLYIIGFQQSTFAQAPNQTVDALNAKAKAFMLKPDSMIVYAEQAYDLARQNNYVFGQAIALKFKGIYEHRTSNFNKAIQYYKQGLDKLIPLKDSVEIGKSYLNIATSYENKNDYVNSLQYGLKALQIFEKRGDNLGKARVLNLLGIAAFQQKDFKQAKLFFSQYNQLAIRARDTVEMASSYNNVGSAYQELGNLDSTLYFMKKAAALHLKKANMPGLAKTYQNIGTLYKKRKDAKNAFAFYNKSAEIFKEIHDRKFLAQTILNIGELYYELKDTVNAEKYLNQTLKIATEVGENDVLQKAKMALAEIKAGDHKFKEAYENLTASLSHKDSVLDLDRTKAIEELKTKYHLAEKEKALVEKQSALLVSEASNQKKQLIIVILTLVAAISVVVIIAVRNNFAKQKRILQKEKELNIQEAKLNATLDSQERERNRFAQDIHDGIGQYITGLRLMVSQLNSDKLLEHKVETVEKIEGVLDNMYKEIRNVAFDLMPQTLINKGLVPALEEFAMRLNASGKIAIKVLSFSDLCTLTKQQEISLYRITQEWVNNVLKYAKAEVITIQLVSDEKEITLTIEDNGIGFDTKKLELGGGNGWRNIQTRVKLINGLLYLDSNPLMNGTIFTIDVPLANVVVESDTSKSQVTQLLS